MTTTANTNAFFPSVSACHLSFFEHPAPLNPHYLLMPKVRDTDRYISLALLNPNRYNPAKVDITPIREHLLRRGEMTPFGERQRSFKHYSSRPIQLKDTLRTGRIARHDLKKKMALNGIFRRINALCGQAYLTDAERRELANLRARLSPLSAEKAKERREAIREEFKRILAITPADLSVMLDDVLGADEGSVKLQDR